MVMGIPSFLLWTGLFLGVGPLCAAMPRGTGVAPPDRQLDFWFGDWEVHDQATGELTGRSHIEPVLHGAAVVMDWRDPDGTETREWFYYHRTEGRWKQVVVNEHGQAKTRVQAGSREDGTLCFRGIIPLRDGGEVIDESTVSACPDGRVHQVIRQSRDHGGTWQTVFDACYVRPAVAAR